MAEHDKDGAKILDTLRQSMAMTRLDWWSHRLPAAATPVLNFHRENVAVGYIPGRHIIGRITVEGPEDQK
jgi:hypothetical protein